MNALEMARTAYTTTVTPTKSNRDTEYDVLARVTSRLKSLDQKRDYPSFVHALHENRQLWIILAVDVADTENALPKHLRAQVFYLAEFTDHHTRKVLSGTATVDALVDVNSAIMAGLRRQGSAE